MQGWFAYRYGTGEGRFIAAIEANERAAMDRLKFLPTTAWAAVIAPDTNDSWLSRRGGKDRKWPFRRRYARRQYRRPKGTKRLLRLKGRPVLKLPDRVVD
jgi:hypothetical protein